MNRSRRTFVAYATKDCTGGDASSWKASFRFCACIGTMNHPSPDLRPPSPHRMGRGKGEGCGSWKALFRFFACIGTMNQLGTPLPALSPQGGERVAASRERGGSWRAKQSFDYLSGEGGGAFVP